MSHVDITALKNREAELLDLRDELEAARDEAEAASQAKSRFLANMSHELRTPLNAVIGFSDIMVQDCATGRDNSPMHAQYARTILESGQHLLSIVEDMLDLARIEAGKLRVLESNVDLVDLVRSASAMALGRGTTTGVTLRERLPEQPLPMRLDARLIRQALINLVGNALKFSRPNSEVTIALTGPDDAGGDVLQRALQGQADGQARRPQRGDQAGRLHAQPGQHGDQHKNADDPDRGAVGHRDHGGVDARRARGQPPDHASRPVGQGPATDQEHGGDDQIQGHQLQLRPQPRERGKTFLHGNLVDCLFCRPPTPGGGPEGHHTASDPLSWWQARLAAARPATRYH